MDFLKEQSSPGELTHAEKALSALHERMLESFKRPMLHFSWTIPISLYKVLDIENVSFNFKPYFSPFTFKQINLTRLIFFFNLFYGSDASRFFQIEKKKSDFNSVSRSGWGKSFQNLQNSHGLGEKSFPHSSSQWECYRKLHWALDRALRVYQRFCQPHWLHKPALLWGNIPGPDNILTFVCSFHI